MNYTRFYRSQGILLGGMVSFFSFQLYSKCVMMMMIFIYLLIFMFTRLQKTEVLNANPERN